MEDGQKKPIPNRLRLHRKRMGYSQRTVAKLLGLYDSVPISQWERGMLLPSAANLIKLSVIFRTYPQALYPELAGKYRKAITALELQLLAAE